MAFLTIDSIPVPIPAGNATEEPDGHGKRRWTFATATVSEATATALKTAAGVPSGAPSDRAMDGTLHTDRALVAVSGTIVGNDPILCEVTVTSLPYRNPLRGSSDCFARRLAITAREG